MQKGFTLNELLVVVLIIGILSAISIPIYTKAIERSKDKEAVSNLKLIKAAEMVYRAERGSFYGPESAESTINTDLHLNLPLASATTWNYDITIPGAGRFQATAQLDSGGYNRTYQITEAITEPTCAVGPCP